MPSYFIQCIIKQIYYIHNYFQFFKKLKIISFCKPFIRSNCYHVSNKYFKLSKGMDLVDANSESINDLDYEILMRIYYNFTISRRFRTAKSYAIWWLEQHNKNNQNPITSKNTPNVLVRHSKRRHRYLYYIMASQRTRYRRSNPDIQMTNAIFTSIIKNSMEEILHPSRSRKMWINLKICFK